MYLRLRFELPYRETTEFQRGNSERTCQPRFNQPVRVKMPPWIRESEAPFYGEIMRIRRNGSESLNNSWSSPAGVTKEAEGRKWFPAIKPRIPRTPARSIDKIRITRPTPERSSRAWRFVAALPCICVDLRRNEFHRGEIRNIRDSRGIVEYLGKGESFPPKIFRVITTLIVGWELT